MYRIIWQPNAEISYEEEINFIFRKWNEFEVLKFQDLVSNAPGYFCRFIIIKHDPCITVTFIISSTGISIRAAI